MKTFLLIPFLILLQIQNKSTTYRHPKLRGIYCCFSSASWFAYDFIDDSTFEFKTEGHFGRTKTRGSYILDHDTIRFTPFPKTKQQTSFYFKTVGPLVIKNDSCLISSNNELHCKITSDGWCYPASKDD